jgi:RNA polymerase sigma-70 factor (ECF subfamily)
VYQASEKQVMVIIRLVKKAQRGDADAYLELFRRYEADLYRTAYVYLNHPDDALDAVQETAYRSFKSIASLKEPKYFKTWLIKIAIRCSLDILKKRGQTVRLDPAIAEQIIAEDAQDVQLQLTLHEMLNGLGEDEKNVILLRFFHGYTIRETAEMLDIPLGTAKTVLYRALKLLRKRSEEDDIDEP